VLDTPRYRTRAKAMADEFRGIDTRSEILRIITQVAADFETARHPVPAKQSARAPAAAPALAY